ncbi:SDR family NAD(P)-dependent oxidoreductase [Dyella acidiphila]|nr:SDR family NAD(P)-dependent oxidoreductase [Dyella acidiphila]
MKRIVIVGATSAIAEHCARCWLETGPADMLLLGRDVPRLERVAADLKARSPDSSLQTAQADFLSPDDIQAWAARAYGAGPVDIVLIAHGTLPDQPQCQADLAASNTAMAINGISPVLFAEAFAGRMQQADHGTLIIIGSVAGDRGRKSNYVYGAAKGLVTRYAQGLQHRLAASQVRVVLVKPGPTDTPMTAHLKEAGTGLAKVEDVARAIVSGAQKGSRTVYAPGKWGLIMMIIRHLPFSVFKKLNI